MEGCTVTFEGNYGGTYFVPCDSVKYFDSQLVNFSNSTIRLQQQISQGQNNNIVLVCQPLSYPYVYDYNQYRYITNVSNVQFNGSSSRIRDFDYILYIVLFSVLLLNVIRFVRGGR